MYRTPLANLVHHAKLPFVGRSAQLAELRRFWRGGASRQSLQVGLIVGEAGVGKSTLLDQFLQELGTECTLAHIRFTPNSSTSLVRAIARALEHTVASNPIISHNSTVLRSLHDVAEAIPAIASAVRLLVVLEDIHLLKEEGMEQLALLLRQLGSVRLSVLCLARPLSVAGNAALEGLIDTTIALEGLQKSEVTLLWQRLFAEQPNSAVVDSITTTTLGNPLVIRSGLLRALSSNAISTAIVPQQVVVSVQLPSLRQSLVDSTRSISTAMTQHLPASALQSLRTLATFGEVFTAEAANLAIPNAEPLLQEFQQRGLLSVAPSIHTSLVPSTTPLAPLLSFSHTVLHRELLHKASADTGALLRVMAAQLPLYSTLPFSLLSDATNLNRFSKEQLLEALQGVYFYLGAIFASDDWGLAEAPLPAAEHLLQAINRISPSQEDDVLIEARISMIMLQMEYSSRVPDLRAYGEQLVELQQQTMVAGLPPALRHYRLVGKAATARNIAFQQPELLLGAVKELFAEAQQWEHEHHGEPYPTGFKISLVALMVLGQRCRYYEAIYWAAQHLEVVLESLDLHNPVELEEYAEMLPFLLLVRRSQAEFAKRLQSIALLESFGPLSSTLLAAKAHLLVMQGEPQKGLEILSKVMPKMQKYQLHIHRLSAAGTLALALGMLGEPMESLAQQTRQMLQGIPADFPNMAAGTAIAETAILAHNIEEVSAVEVFFPTVRRQANKKVLRYFAAVHHDADSIRQMKPPVPDPSDPYEAIADVFASAELTRPVEAKLVAQMKKEIVEILDLLPFRAVLLAVEWMGTRGYPIQSQLLPAAQQGICRWIEWLTQRQITTYSNGLIERFGQMLPVEELERWKERAGEGLSQA
ncbi:MAG: AAA family ATPase [Chlorobi bacterium]|nr:AAA family ATPase [Chlorobiota bacterium]